jgi:uncharacterized membrane protein
MLDTIEATDATPASRLRSRHPLMLAVLSLAAAILYGACEFLQFATFRSGTYDLVIFDQAVRSYSHFHWPVSIAAVVHRGFGTNFALLGDHFSPILALLAPLYWIHSGPQTLLVAQALLFAAAIPPLWVFVRRELGSSWAAYCVAVGYAISWPVAQAVSFDFHEVAFAPVLTAVLFERWSAYRLGRARWWHVVLPAIGLLLVKEDMGLLVAGFGLAVLVKSIRTKQARLLGAGFVAGGLVAIVLTTDVILPAFGSNPKFYWQYGQFGPNVPSAAWDMLTHPLLTANTFVSPADKVHTMVCLAGLAAFLGLLSPWLLVVVPVLADRMLADQPHWWGMDFHYNAFLIIPVLCGGVDAVARLARWTRRWPWHRWITPVWASAVLVIAIGTVHEYAFDPLLHSSSWQRNPAAQAAVDHVPSGVTVAAVNNLGPQLTGRTTVLLWDRRARWTPWVVADVRRPTFPFCGVTDQLDQVTYLESHGYQQVFADDGYLVLHHPGPLPPIDTTQSPGC